MIIGTTQVFDECYHRYSDKRLRIFRGEYAYHKRVLRDSGSSINAYNSWAFLDTPTQQLGDSLKNGFTDPLKKGDWIIISQPFCGNGNLQPRFEQILDEASRLGGIPVILDCAWYGTCININIDATHPAITAVCFSLSKAIGMGNMRVGIRYSDFNDSMPIAQHNEYNHLVLVSAQLGIYMMEHFGPDYIPNKYRQWQLEICEEAGLTPTNCMHLALGPWEQPWKEKFMIDETYIKVGIREALKARRKGEL